MGKLNLDVEKINKSRQSAKNIADEVQKFIDLHTTVATERTVVRLLGVDGVDEIGKPLPNVVVDNIKEGGGLQRGAAYWMGNAIANLQITPQEVAEKISKGELDITRLPAKDEGKIREVIYKIASESVEKIRNVRKTREHYLNTLGEGPKPYLYVIVATGNIYEDIIQAKAAAKQGA
ncbi:MAG TPA: lysine 5,6-aminomutase subunit alpha, partial [Soehngenia sp.]|nr:lysine 5,6-aminomutase subunit alpha [Soehngenia sp.]